MTPDERIEELQAVVKDLYDQLDSYQNMIAILIQKLGSPVIISEHDIREAPSVGHLTITGDKPTGAILLTFEEQTSLDSKPDSSTDPTGPA